MKGKHMIGKAIKDGLIKRGWKNPDLAGLLGVTASEVSNWVRGVRVPPGDKLLKIAKILDIGKELLDAETDITDKAKSRKIDEIRAKLDELEEMG